MTEDHYHLLKDYMQRENDNIRELLSIARDESSRDHAAVRAEIGEVRTQVDAIASRLNVVEDTHAAEKAHEQGAQQARLLVGRLVVNIVSIAVAVIGAWYVIADHMK